LDDERKLDLEFFWFHRPLKVPRYIEEIPSMPGDRKHGPNYVSLINPLTGENFRSGDRVRLSTNNPEKVPLPDIRLLEMQWMLNRVTAISGAAQGEYENHQIDEADYMTDN
jgi:hypothetical protein